MPSQAIAGVTADVGILPLGDGGVAEATVLPADPIVLVAVVSVAETAPVKGEVVVLTVCPDVRR